MEARAYWLQTMLKIADPVLKNLAAGTLKQNMPMVFHPDLAGICTSKRWGGRSAALRRGWNRGWPDGRRSGDSGGIPRADPQGNCKRGKSESPDVMNFTEGYGRALVDAAFLARGIVRAPKSSCSMRWMSRRSGIWWAPCARRGEIHPVRDELALLFSAMVEAALRVMGEKRLRPDARGLCCEHV